MRIKILRAVICTSLALSAPASVQAQSAPEPTYATQHPMQFYVLGEVVHPGLYSASEPSVKPETADSAKGEEGTTTASNYSVSEALEMSGGARSTADLQHVRVTRMEPHQVLTIDLWKSRFNRDSSQNPALKPGDIIYVPKSSSDTETGNAHQSESSPKVRVYGAVKSPGLLVISSNDDILSMIHKAGGFDFDAITSQVWLSHINSDGTITTEKIDISGKTNERAKKVLPGDVIIVKRSRSKLVSKAPDYSDILHSKTPIGDFGPAFLFEQIR